MTGAPPPVVVVGAGASGLMAAYWASGRGRPVLLIEGTAEGGRKILISGGGRCNILPSVPSPERFVTDASPNTLKNMLRSWPLPEQRAFFERELGLPLVLEEETGKLFPDCQSARKVRDTLVEAVRGRGAQVRFGCRVSGLSPGGEVWHVTLDDGSALEASALVIATGGRSVPATGSDGWGLEALARLGHRVVPTYPALTPLVADPAPHAHLAGVSLEVRLEAPGPRGKIESHGGFLFTHRGYSGPAVLDVSHTAVRSRLAGGPRQPILACWTEMDPAGWERLLLAHRGAVQALLAKHLPSRLAETLCREAGLAEGASAAQLRREQRRQLVELLTRYPLPWTGDEGYAKAEVTGGGVDLGEVDRRTLESRLHRRLFLCGEILDAFGPIGGHNFQWAWATGRSAGLGATAAAAAS
jgi:predicted Rossmann fold flavoprotein